MKVTAGLHIDKAGKSYSSVAHHNERKKQYFKDKNIHINWKLTRYNQVGKLCDANLLLEAECEPYVKKYNQRQINQGHRKRCYKSVKQYVQKRAKRAKRRGIVWLGSTAFRDHFEKQTVKKLKKKNPNLTNDQIKFQLRTKVEPKIIKRELIGFNKRHKYMKICRYAIHVDEDFIHAHVEIVALPHYTHNKNPRPSFNFNKALEDEYPNAIHRYHTKTIGRGKNKKTVRGNFKQRDGRIAAHMLADDESNALIKGSRQIIGQYTPLSLKRTGNATSLSGDQYKHYASMRDKDNEETSKASSAASKARSASSAKSTAVTNYKSYMKDFFVSGYNDGSKAGSIANRKSASSALNSTVNSFNSSAYSGYASVLSNGLTRYLPKNKQSNLNWLALAKGHKVKAGGKTISDPLAFYAKYQTSKADSASSAYNSTINSNQSLKAENSSLISKNKKLKKVNKSTINLRNNLANDFRTAEDQPHLNHMSNHLVFRTLILWERHSARKIAKLVWDAKEKAKQIIKDAKDKAKNLIRPSKDGERVMRDFIWKHEDCYPNVYHKTPDKLNSDQLMQSFNDTAHNYHKYDSPEAQRENQQIKARSHDNGPTWGE